MVDSVPRVPLVRFCRDTLEDMNTCAMLCFKQQKVEATIIQSRWEWWNKRGNQIKPKYPHGTTLEPHDGQFWTQFVGIFFTISSQKPRSWSVSPELGSHLRKNNGERANPCKSQESMDRFEGKSIGNPWFFHGFSYDILGDLVNFPLTENLWNLKLC